MPINYDGRIFGGVANSANGEVSSQTRLHYHQQGSVVWATLSGGNIRWGTLLAIADENGRLDMRYQHINEAGELKTGTCQAEPEVLPDGRLRLHERWQWTCGDFSKGESVIEEVRE
ncbi:MAG: n-acetylglutamate synthase [Chitinivibrionales bacterium]|nr:n-acetylglutamate synthase [Chitinivibrionales bacterium]